MSPHKLNLSSLTKQLKTVCMSAIFFLLHAYPCWMSSLSFATFLSSITVEDKTQSRRDVYATVPQEQLSLMTGSMQCLITSLVSQTNSRLNSCKIYLKKKQKKHSFRHAQHLLTSSNLFAELGIANEAVEFLRRFLQHSGVHWEGKEAQVTALF